MEKDPSLGGQRANRLFLVFAQLSLYEKLHDLCLNCSAIIRCRESKHLRKVRCGRSVLWNAASLSFPSSARILQTIATALLRYPSHLYRTLVAVHTFRFHGAAARVSNRHAKAISAGSML